MEKVKQLSSVYNWFAGDKVTTTIGQLSDNQILHIANDINGLFSETNLIESKPELSLPKLVVVGSQSSGKSSVLNGIMSMDILPTGKNMVTRTPLSIGLHQLSSDAKDGWVEFGNYNQDGWKIEKKIPITVPIPSETEIKTIREYIMKKTEEIAGPGMDINETPINVNIYSPNVPNLSLVDLPGLTIVACQDRGQPVNIKEKIEDLVASYIKQERTIILAVMQSRSDLETDIGLGLIKKYDNGTNNRIIGVLTKPDLMNQETHIGEYLMNNISKNLMLTYGYYVVKNRSGTPGSPAAMDVFKGYELEKEYFNTHPEYKKTIYKDRIGTGNLTQNLSKILISSITELLPSVMTELATFEGKINTKLESMGSEIPDSKEGKLILMNKYVSNFYYKFMDSIESRGTTVNTGKLIKDTFITFRSELNDIKPFSDKKIYCSDYFKNIASSFEGNHMSFHIPPIQILEACMTDPKHKPILTLQQKSLKCVDSIIELLINLIRNITMQEEFSQYPQLAAYVMSSIIDEIISKTKNETKQYINRLLQNEQDYIWTDSKEFLDLLGKIKTDINNINELLDGYFSSIKSIVSHSVPKIIMTGIIREIQNTTLSFLLHNIVSDDKIYLLKQDEEIEKQRLYYCDLKNRVLTIKKSFVKINK